MSERLRDVVGYGRNIPKVKWPNDAKIAINIVVNYEEGSEYSHAMGDGENEQGGAEGTYNFPKDTRNLAMETMYEYGSRAGIWRLFRLFDDYDINVTMFGCAIAFELNPDVAKYAREAGHDLLSHGWRWCEHWRFTREEEREQIRRAVASFEKTWGERPRGWYCRYGPSVNTRDLVVEEGGFIYDSDAYNDDLPYFTEVRGKRHLVIPYSLCYNDYDSSKPPTAFADLLKRGFDELYREGEKGYPKMMSVGLHPRIVGQAGRVSALREFIEYALDRGDVWFARRGDIADWWIENHESFENAAESGS